MKIHLETLGHIDLKDDEGQELRTLLTQSKRLALLVYLTANGTDRLCRRDTLLAMFWPESDTEKARASLRQSVHFIRHIAGSDVVVSRGAEELGIQPGAVHADMLEMERLATNGKYSDAFALYHGDFLDGFYVRGAPEFERWVAGERDRYKRLAAECAWHVVSDHASSGHLESARQVAERAVGMSVDNEVAIRRFITLLARSGDTAAALAVYREFAAQLSSEYGAEPSRETLMLVESLAHSTLDAHAAPSVLVDLPLTTTITQPAAAATHEALPAKPRGRRKFIIAACLTAVAAGLLYKTSHQPPPQAVANRVAVLPFVVKGSEEIRYLHDGMPLLLSTRLDGVPNLHTVDMRAILIDQAQRTGDSLSLTSASETARRFGAQLYIVGTVVGSAGQLNVAAELYDRATPDKPLARVQVHGAETELVALTDRVAAGLLADRFRETGVLVAEIAARTTNSFVALKAWLDGESQMARGRYGPAVASFSSAIAADSMFAMAHYRLAVAAAWAGSLALVGPSATRAVALSADLPPQARLIIQAFRDSRTGRYGLAEAAERKLLAEQPTAIDAWFDLAEILFHSNPARGRPISEARDPFEQLLRMDPNNFAAMLHLVRLATVRGDRQAVDSLTRRTLAGDPDGPHRAELLLLRTLALDDRRAESTFIAMPAELTLLDAMWRAAEYTERLDEAQRIATRMRARPATPEMRNSLLAFLAHCALGRERFAQASSYADSLYTFMPRYGAAVSAMIAMHPATGAQRGLLLKHAGTQLRAAALTRSENALYAGGSHKDYDQAGAFQLHQVLVNDALQRQAGAARQLPPEIGRLPDHRSQVLLESALARTRADTVKVMESELQLDSLYSNAYSPQQSISPRIWLVLDLSRKLADAGRTEDALRRLSTVPEDFGFNISLLAEVHRQRAALLAKLGRVAEPRP